MHRCCPITCDVGPLTEQECKELSGRGSCIYPNTGQICDETYPPSTSVCLILFPERAADSKKCLRDMKILNIVSKTLTSLLITLKIFWSEISVVVKIFTDFDLLTIVEFQIYSFILPILQANLGKILAKIHLNCTYRNYTIFFFKSFVIKFF